MGPAVARIGRKRAFKPVDRALIILRRKRRLAGAGERHGQRIDLAVRLLSQHAARYTGEPQGKGHRNWRITHQQLHKPVSRSEESRVGTEGVSKVRSRWSPVH